ncbi:DNA-binding transcriptional regulator, LacI/PurR family [Paenibacillus uliginis N3/975]|uniref:DNA-binding transcriptional regulator, LacI/PurR family n=1 Tax=Paenibacillus uliginis N3/975 TaxID=1313296 RepID=A0A1X7GWF5_9BACL|nr:GntR family transcriptional regulator [Paenibacillus uliginis]SMF75603.1 DNA-binding transcriptional regulator, LacI/PurR family [Paenibacillus uliginis N3/975]
MNTRSGKLFEQMKDQVLNIILESGLKPHDPLPSEGELADRFGVSRMTGKLALQALQEEGIVYRLPRRGTFLADVELEELRQSAGMKLAYDSKHPRRTGHYIALIVPSIDDYVGSIITSVELAAKEQGFEVVIKVTGDEAAEAKAVRSLSRQSDITGILLFPVDRKICGDHLLRLKLQKYPIVILDRQFNEIGFDSVSHDHYRGAYDMTSHLLRIGHREIGFITSHMNKVRSREERYQGYIDALLEWKVEIHADRMLFMEVNETGLTGVTAKQTAIQTFLNTDCKLTAVFCSDDFLAMSTLNAALSLGFKLPERLSIAGFSNHSVLQYAQLRMTTVGQPMNDFGSSAVRLVMDRLDNPDGDPVTIRLKTELMTSDSTMSVI